MDLRELRFINVPFEISRIYFYIEAIQIQINEIILSIGFDGIYKMYKSI